MGWDKKYLSSLAVKFMALIYLKIIQTKGDK